MFLEFAIEEEINEEAGVWCCASTTFIDSFGSCACWLQ